MQKILIIGAGSAIAEATARRFAQQGASLYLLGRSPERLEAMASDLKIRGAASVGVHLYEANDFASHQPVIDQAIAAMGGIDLALIAHGTLGDQKACEQSFELTLKELNTNAISVISMLTHLANVFERSRQGTIAVIGSVAGDRGRQSNYVYGTAKGALSVFLSGLRNRLYKSGVQVLTIKPGFVDTPMTASFAKGPLWSSPEKVALGIEKAVTHRRDVAYLPSWWALIMLVIRLIPEPIFKRMSL